MARIVLGIATSHGPLLSTPPQDWGERVKADRENPALWYRGHPYRYDALAALRAEERLDRRATLEERRARSTRCRKALGGLAETFRQVKPDVVVIVGNDQHEVFDERNMPAFSVFWGDAVENGPPTEAQIAQMPPGTALATYGHRPIVTTRYPCAAGLGRHIIGKMMELEFDVGQSNVLPRDGQEWSRGGLPHAFGFVLRQIMQDLPVPHVPVMINTFYPPNQPTARRCYRFGRALHAAISSWPDDARVAVIASGGLSHFVVDEELDRRFLDLLQQDDGDALGELAESYLQSGTSEMKNWIPVGAAMGLAGLRMELVDYVPCYRSDAGTGNAMGFVRWL